jgi:sugar phosphate permease
MGPIKRPKPTTVVLGLLCVMYLITYVDRVNISTAADSIKRELALSNTQLGFLQSAFGYPYLIFQIFGGWIGDRFGPRRTLFLCGLIWLAGYTAFQCFAACMAVRRSSVFHRTLLLSVTMAF